jgi:hypothetical protein
MKINRRCRAQWPKSSLRHLFILSVFSWFSTSSYFEMYCISRGRSTRNKFYMRQGSPTSNNPVLCTLCFGACTLNIQHTSRESSLCYTHVSLTFKLSKLSIIISLETVSREIGMRLAHRHRSTVGCRVHACASRYRNLDYSSRGLMEVKSYPCALPTFNLILLRLPFLRMNRKKLRS